MGKGESLCRNGEGALMEKVLAGPYMQQGVNKVQAVGRERGDSGPLGNEVPSAALLPCSGEPSSDHEAST